MRAGRLDRLITIQRKTVTHSDSGEPIDTWANIDDATRRPASMSPVRGDERFGGDQYVAKDQIEFRIHYSESLAELTPVDRVLFPAPIAGEEGNAATRTIHDIIAVHEIGRREGLQIITARRADVT